MNKIFKIILLLNLLISYTFANEIPKVILKVNSKNIKQGKELKIVLWVLANRNSKIIFPKINSIATYKIIDKKEYKNNETITTKNNNKLKLITKSIKYTIKPNKNFTIPSYTIIVNNKKYKTQSKKIKVFSTQAKAYNGSFIFKMDSSKYNVVVGESFIVNVELIEPYDASSADIKYSPPSFKNFKVTSNNEGKVTEHGSTIIREQEYIYTATKPGKFTIKAAKAKIGIQNTPQAQSPFAFFGVDIQWKTLKSNPLIINVSKAPKNIAIVGNYKIYTITNNKTSVKYIESKKDKPVNFSIIIEGEGNLNNINNLKIDIPNVTIYNKDSNIKQGLENGKPINRFTKKYVFISDHDFTIPSVKIKAYNPENKKTYTLSTNPIVVKIKKSYKISSIREDEKENKTVIKHNLKTPLSIEKIIKNNHNIKTITNDKVEKIIFDKNYYKKKYGKKSTALTDKFIYIFIGLILGILGTIILPKLYAKIFNKKQKTLLYGSYKEALNILYPHIDTNKEIEDMVKLLYEVINGNKEIKIDERKLKNIVKKVKKQ